jgi:MoaA/NifB/PqqE/SkfB family radical SAM enzyme
VPLAVRQDWQDVLAAASLGTTTVWVAFHGLGVEHDRQVNRPGGYAETCLAIQRVHAAGLRAGANVFVTTATAGQAERLLGALGRLGVDQMVWEPVTYYPTPRGRGNERLRQRPSELLALADRIRQLSPFHRDAWANLEAYTEAAWVARALAGDWPSQLSETASRHGDQGLPLVCCPGLELHTGVAGRYRERHGNLRADGAQAVLGRALEQGWRSVDAVWFRPDPLPSIGELAARHGDRTGRACTSPRRRVATGGGTGRGEPDGLPLSPARGG